MLRGLVTLGEKLEFWHPGEAVWKTPRLSGEAPECDTQQTKTNSSPPYTGFHAQTSNIHSEITRHARRQEQKQTKKTREKEADTEDPGIGAIRHGFLNNYD